MGEASQYFIASLYAAPVFWHDLGWSEVDFLAYFSSLVLVFVIVHASQLIDMNDALCYKVCHTPKRNNL